MSNYHYYSFARRAVSTVNAAVTMQIGLTALSVGCGTGIFGGDGEESKLLASREVFDASHYKLVANYISSLYNNSREATSPHQERPRPQQELGVKLSELATWEDPKCIFQGETEIYQAFRLATQGLANNKKNESGPRCVNVEPQGQSIILTYALSYDNNYNQQSLLRVTVEMHQIKTSPEFNEFVITKMEEQWNGIPLFRSLLFWIVRRINGFGAFHFTKGLGW